MSLPRKHGTGIRKDSCPRTAKVKKIQIETCYHYYEKRAVE